MKTIALLAPIVLGGLCACGSADTPSDATDGNTQTSAVMESIVGGVPASATYPEAALLNMKSSGGLGYACSASLIAPKVILTAGHCVDGMSSWDVYVGANYRASTRGETFDWAENGATTVNPKHHDVGLVYLNDPIVLPSYPVLAQAKVADGTKALSVGRILNGVLTNSLYDASITVRDGTASGYPFDYSSNLVIEHGDSGGPVYVAGTHNLIAVNSGAGTSTQVVARVDLVSAWIQQRIAAQTTGGAGADAGAPDSGPRPTDAGAPDASTGSTGTCVQEKETNDSFATANAAGSIECGALQSTTDRDWFTFAAPVGVTTVTLAPSADATMQIGYVSRSTCVTSLTGQRSVRVTVSGAPTTLCVSVTSAARQTQTYRLTH